VAAQIRWNSGAGEQTLTSTSSLARFNRWKPDPAKIGEESQAVGDGVGYQWSHRTDYSVSFEFSLIANSDDAEIQDFLEWANSYGVFSIDTGDGESNSYEQVQIGFRAKITLSDPDPETMEYTMTFPRVINIAAAPIPIRRVY
jgi:hypothetical protein